MKKYQRKHKKINLKKYFIRSKRNEPTSFNDYFILANIIIGYVVINAIMFLFINSIIDKL